MYNLANINKALLFEALEYFYEQAKKNMKNGSTKGSQKKNTEIKIDEALKALGIVCNVSFGQRFPAGYRASKQKENVKKQKENIKKQGIAFVRADVLGKEYVNSEKPTPRKGIYIWFCYMKEMQSLCLEFGFCWDDDEVPCKAFETMNKKDGCFGDDEGERRKFYNDFKNHKDEILNDFLEFVEYYKGIDACNFELM